MPQLGGHEQGNFVGDTLDRLKVGIWSRIDSKSTVRCCPVAARLFGVPAADAWRGLPLERYAEGVHPEDRELFYASVNHAERTGEPLFLEYRTLVEPNVTYKVLDRGEYDLGPKGNVLAARGLVIDITDNGDSSIVSRQAFHKDFFVELPPLDRAVEHALALHELLKVFSEKRRHLAEQTLANFLDVLGREVAASLESQIDKLRNPRDFLH